MRVIIEESEKKVQRKFPYLVEDKDMGLVLVGRYSAIVLDPEYDGDSWQHGEGKDLDLNVFIDRWKDLPTGTKITLVQE